MHAAVSVVVIALVIPAIPGPLHCRPDNGFYESQAIQLNSGESLFRSTANNDKCTRLGDAKQEVHLIDKVSPLNVLAIVLTGMESIRLRIAKPAEAWLIRSHCHLVQGVEQIRACQVAIQVVTSPVRRKRMVQDLRRRVGMKRQQTCSIVRNGRTYQRDKVLGN